MLPFSASINVNHGVYVCCVIFVINKIESFTSRNLLYWQSITVQILPVKQTNKDSLEVVAIYA
jgi:hypothetical protein